MSSPGSPAPRYVTLRKLHNLSWASVSPAGRDRGGSNAETTTWVAFVEGLVAVEHCLNAKQGDASLPRCLMCCRG